MPYGTGTTQFTLSPDGKTIALGLSDRLELRELKSGRVLRKIRRWLPEPAASQVSSPSFSADGSRIAFEDDLAESAIVYANGKRDEIGMFSVKTGRRLRTFGWNHTDIRDVTFSPDGKYLAVLGWISRWPRPGQNKALVESYRVLVCDARSGRILRALPTRDQMHALAFTRNGTWLAAGSRGKGVQVWDAHTGKLALDRPGKKGGTDDSVDSLAFMPDNTLIVGADKVLFLSIHSKHKPSHSK